MAEDKGAEQEFDPLVIDTTTGRKHGRDNCPQCGATDVSPRPGTAGLICNFCRYEWVGQRLEEMHGLGEGIGALSGRVVTSGAADMTSDEVMVTIKCSACGAEVIIDTSATLESRCHWCRHILSINDKIPNGAVPDGVLTFEISKDLAMTKIREFVGKRKFFAHHEFKHEFKPENVMAVYLPYMTVDANVRARLFGRGEIQTRRYTVQHGKTSTTYYDADSYSVVREFDLHVDDLIVESSMSKSNFDDRVNTNNIINAILPFDVKNIVAFDSNYLQGATAEKRDMNIDDVARAANGRFLTMARHSVVDTLRQYDRGVEFTAEEMKVFGSRWASVYLPVWLYSYGEKQDNGRMMIHYIAVNGRNGTTMGSVPVNKGKLFGMSALVTALVAIPCWIGAIGMLA